MANRYNVLIVEDESNICSFMGTILKANNYNYKIAKSGAEARMYITSYCPDLIILDLGLPDMDGMQLIKEVRRWSQMPIIVVSARSRERDKVEALDLGADDYITKPFGTSELLARVRTAIRHMCGGSAGQLAEEGRLVIRDLTVDYDKRRVYKNGEDAGLTQTEYKIVSLLARHAGKVLTYEYIIKQIWGPNADSDNQVLRVNMANIRRKIEESPAEPQYVFTEIGVGYRMLENE